MERLLEETSHPKNAAQTRGRDVFGSAKPLPGKSPCLLPPRAPCFAPQAGEQRERAGLFHGGGRSLSDQHSGLPALPEVGKCEWFVFAMQESGLERVKK